MRVQDDAVANMQVIPSINETLFAEVQAQLLKAESFLYPNDWIHIDIHDGGLAIPHTTLSLELHCMIAEPEQRLAQYLDVLQGATDARRRVIVQYEAMRDPAYILSLCREAGVAVGLSLAPDTDPEFLGLYVRDFTFLNLLAVTPGPSGQQFQSSVLPKIRLLKQRHPNVILEIDGGITPETARFVKDAGADVMVSGSYIFESPSPRAAYEELMRA